MIESIPYVLTGIGIIVSIIYYTSVLRNANKTREVQLFANIYNQMDTPEKARAVNSVLKRRFTDFNELITKYIENPARAVKKETNI